MRLLRAPHHLSWQSAAFSRTERMMILLQWGVMFAVASLLLISLHPADVVLTAKLGMLLFGTALLNPLCYELLLRLANPWLAVNLPARYALLTAFDVTIGTTFYFEATSRPVLAQILLFCVVALAATRYKLSRALGITTLISFFLVFSLLIARVRTDEYVTSDTILGSVISLYVITYLVALLRMAERRENVIALDNERLYRTVLGHNRELNAINKLIHVLAPQEDVEAMLTQALAVICAALSAPGGLAYRVVGADQRPELVAWHGETPGDAGNLPMLESVRDAVLRRDLVITDAVRGDGEHTLTVPRVAIPLIVQGDVLCVLQITLPTTDEEPSWATNPELQTLQILCNELAVALDNALLRHKVQETALSQEKDRIAQELHDTVAQILFSIGLGLEWGLRHVAPGTDVYAKLLELKRLSGQGTTEIRSAIFTLASQTGQGDLVSAIRKLVADLGEKHGWQTNVVVTGAPCQPQLLVRNAVHRIVREGMINTYKHAQASEVMVSLRFVADGITVVVQDNGCGRADVVRTAMAGQNSHFGLRTVQAQVMELSGSFDVYDADERGLVLRATIPTTTKDETRAPRSTAQYAALATSNQQVQPQIENEERTLNDGRGIHSLTHR